MIKTLIQYGVKYKSVIKYGTNSFINLIITDFYAKNELYEKSLFNNN